MSSPLWLAVRFSRLPLESQSPEPSRPAIISEARQVLLANQLAEDQGILPGMPINTAHALCPALQVFPRAAEQEARLLEQRGHHLLAITPMVSLTAADTLLLEVGSCLKLHGGIEALLARLLAILEQQHWPAEIGLGHTPRAAQQMSHDELRASLLCLTAGQANPQAFIDTIGKQPIAALAISAQLKNKLTAPGFRQLAELFSLPRPALGKRFGKAFLKWLQQLLGEVPDPRQPVAETTPFLGQISFSQPVAISDQLALPMQQLLAELNDYLRSRQLVTRAIRWRLLPESFAGTGAQATALLIRRARPDLDMNVWLDLSLRRLNEQHLRHAIAHLRLDCARPRPAPLASNTLFSQHQRPDMLPLLEKLPTDLQLYQPSLADAQLPELEEQQQSPGAPTAAAEHHPISLASASLWLFDPPKPLDAKTANTLQWRNQTLTLLPDRQHLTSHWWQLSEPGEIQREYHLARHRDGWYGRVFRDAEGRWWLQGVV